MSKQKIQIFISFKNTDSDGEKTIEAIKAEEIYNYLTKRMGFNVFMMNETLMKKGVSEYKRFIDSSLEEASVLILLASKEKHVTSEWVFYEWDTFLEEMLSGRKKGHLFTVLFDPMSVPLLPIALRKYQSFNASDLNPLYSFIESYFREQKESGKISFIYPCIFKKTDQCYKAYFPDLKIEAMGIDIDEAYLNAQNLLMHYFMYALKYEVDVEAPSKISELKNKVNKDDYLMLVNVTLNVKGEPEII